MALQGLKVLDLTRLLPGPLCTHFLTRLGAQVIKVEGVESENQLGDYTRLTAPHLFEAINAGKQGIAINLRDEAGKTIFKRLVKDADVLVEGNRPGAMKRLGLDFESLKMINKRLIYCSISGYGATGPFSLKAGHDINYQSLAGLLGISGKAGALPPLTGFQPADGAGAMQATIGILAAVIGRSQSGEGQFVDVSLTESAMALGIISLSAGLAGSKITRGTGILDGGLPQYNVYETKDNKFLTIGALEDHFWKRIVAEIQRTQPNIEIDFKSRDSISALIRTKDLQEWVSILGPLDTCVEPVIEPTEIFSHPQHLDRGVVLPETASTARQIVLGPRLSSNPVRSLNKAPRLGQHTRDVLIDAGLAESEVDQLIASKSVQGDTASAVCTQDKPYRMQVEKGKDYWWCSCGRSANQPFCDGSHKGTTFLPVKVTVEEDGVFPFCGCRRSLKGPRCDGAHKKKV